MAEPKDKQEQAALERAEVSKRPLSLADEGAGARESAADLAAFERPVRPEHTFEKEHPPAKE